jgi:hypothetical protein
LEPGTTRLPGLRGVAVRRVEVGVFCLVEAPSAEAARAVHEKAHRLVADQIFPVEEGA